MRRNRQKLHRELRLRAEAHKAEVRRRQQAARERDRHHSFSAPARRRAPAALAPDLYAMEWSSIANLLTLAHVDAATQDKVSRLCRTLSRGLPQFVSAEWLPWLLLLSLPPWVRPVERLRLPGGSLRRKKEAVALHLFARFPVPAFLLRALEVEPLPVARVPVEDLWAVEVLAHVGRGASIRALAGTPAFPAPLTRAMCHHFLDAIADTPPVAALRRAQVIGFRGPPSLALRLLATRLGDLHGPDERTGEPAVQRFIHWLCRRPALHDADPMLLDEVAAWALARSREEPSFSLEGRAVGPVLRQVSLIRTARALDADLRDVLPDAGIPPWSEGSWTVEQIVRRRSLWEEGEHMHHCVAMYTNLARKRKVAVFSLCSEGARVATIEVALGAGAVVQAKGFANRALSAAEFERVQRWAEFARYRVAL